MCQSCGAMGDCDCKVRGDEWFFGEEDDMGEQTWEQWLEVSGYKELTETVRYYRKARGEQKKSGYEAGYKDAGLCLYDLQKTLKSRFNIDIAKVRS